jgi:NAD(P)-dependent dehydrogenase (short-subunit alcohol dehydrogenase family)
MTEKIVLAGATGDLGTRIARALSKRGAEVVALGRTGVPDDKVKALESLGVKVRIVNMASVSDIAKACDGAACVVSVLSGLRDVVVDTQSIVLEAALTARVPRFIPSDFCMDFRLLSAGENRNLDLRREFHKQLDVAPIASTSVFNGPFGEVLTMSNHVPLFDFKNKMVGYWEDPDWKIGFTAMNDVAAYTAAAALDQTTPRALRIASFRMSPRELAKFTAEVMKTPFQLVRLGALEDLRAHNKSERAAHPEGENELYPRWQVGQYLQTMFSTRYDVIDNDRYSDLKWTSLADLVAQRA